MITSYALLIIPMGLLLQCWWKRKGLLRVLSYLLPIAFIGLNLFQIWQFKHYILHPYTTTQAYYFAVFGKTSIGYEEQQLLAWERTFEPEPLFRNQQYYKCRKGNVLNTGLRNQNMTVANLLDTVGKGRLGNGAQWGYSLRMPYQKITPQSHAWIKCQIDVFLPSGYDERAIHFTATMDREEGYYGYSALPYSDLQKGAWQTLERTYLSPHIRNKTDTLEVYIWSADGSPYYYDNLRLEICERKDGK